MGRASGDVRRAVEVVVLGIVLVWGSVFLGGGDLEAAKCANVDGTGKPFAN